MASDPAPTPIEELSDPLGPRVSFWQKPWVQNALPLASSVAIHGFVVLFGWIFLLPAIAMLRPVVQEQVIIPDSTLAESGPAGGIPNPGLGEDPNRAAAQDSADVTVTSQGWAERPSQTLNRALMGDAADTQADSMISIGGANSIGRSTGAGNPADGGQLAPFGIPGGGAGALGPKVSFIGVGGNAKKIVFVLDASGSMLQTRELVKDAVNRAVDRLVPIQEFAIIIAFEDEVVEFPKTGLIRATAIKKQESRDWLQEHYTPRLGTEPESSLRAAFKRQPELIYVLSDGFEAIGDPKDVNGLIEKLNAGRKIKVNTLFLRTSGISGRESDYVKQLQAIMSSIAEENGGIFKTVYERDFGQ